METVKCHHHRKFQRGCCSSYLVSAQLSLPADAVTNKCFAGIDVLKPRANIGTFLAEGPNNIVPETVRISGRNSQPQSSKSRKKHAIKWLKPLEKIACRKYHAALQYTTEVSYAFLPYSREKWSAHPATSGLLWHFWSFLVSIVPTGGGSDANILTPTGSVRWWLEPAWKKPQRVRIYYGSKTWKHSKAFCFWNLWKTDNVKVF